MRKRIIFTVNVQNGQVTEQTRSARSQLDSPVEIAKLFEDQGIDEILLNNVGASQAEPIGFLRIVEQVKQRLSIPVIVSGGIRSADDLVSLREAGCDKILITSVAVKDPDFVSQAVAENGSSRILVGIELKRVYKPDSEVWEVHINGGRIPVGLEVVPWAKQLEELGVGELILAFVDADRSNKGFDVEMTRVVADAVKIGVAVSGDPGSAEDLKLVLTEGKASAVLLSGTMGDYITLLPEVNNQIA